MANVVYILCAATSIICAVLLLRGYFRSGQRLLFWSGWAFVGMALNNVLLIVDIRIIPDVDISMWRSVPALIGVALLLYGLIWETR